ncbi:hypothetical protein IWQ60_001429 [Tieghemiomyces parasiticus]|uniref:Uncharacterized protein n=1 Tax=Tieghemiomyces parasiticus TaxID=78921 RepID=A0A9W8E1W3_9FUNG|nr:hypothetical protein IWQ60_001429 [Tieghemiomyces parasiticus]
MYSPIRTVLAATLALVALTTICASSDPSDNTVRIPNRQQLQTLTRRSLPPNALRIAQQITKVLVAGAIAGPAVNAAKEKCREVLGWKEADAKALGQEVTKAIEVCHLQK